MQLTNKPKKKLGTEIKTTVITVLETAQETALFVHGTASNLNSLQDNIAAVLSESLYEAKADAIEQKINYHKARAAGIKELTKAGLTEEEATAILA